MIESELKEEGEFVITNTLGTFHVPFIILHTGFGYGPDDLQWDVGYIFPNEMFSFKNIFSKSAAKFTFKISPSYCSKPLNIVSNFSCETPNNLYGPPSIFSSYNSETMKSFLDFFSLNLNKVYAISNKSRLLFPPTFSMKLTFCPFFSRLHN